MTSDGEAALPYWWLISILFSTRPLTVRLATQLHAAAFDLYRTDADHARLDEPLMTGEIRNLRTTTALGAITGPSFEATVETEQGANQVRFILTNQGLELMAQQRSAPVN